MRVIGTFGVFVGIFAVVVVAIISTINVAELGSAQAMEFSPSSWGRSPSSWSW